LHKLFKASEMKGLLRGGRGLLLGIILIGFSSWGFLVHRTIHQLAVYQLPAEMAGFFHSNMGKLVYDAPRADTRRNTDSTEAPKHFIDLEPFNEKPAYDLPQDFNKAIENTV
jgi:hypothetical protein